MNATAGFQDSRLLKLTAEFARTMDVWIFNLEKTCKGMPGDSIPKQSLVTLLAEFRAELRPLRQEIFEEAEEVGLIEKKTKRAGKKTKRTTQ